MAMPEISHKAIREPQETIARIESKVAEAARKAELAAAAAKAAIEEDVTRRAEAYEKDRPAPALKAGAAKEAAEAAQLDVAALRQALANAEAKLDQAREANKTQLVAAERKDLEKVTRGLTENLDGVTKAIEEMREIKRRIGWLSSGRTKGHGQQFVPAMPGEGGEERVGVETVLEALRGFARDPEPKPQPPSGPARILPPGAVVAAPAPLIETLISGPEAA
jgi:hypothetical protein